MSAYLTLHTLDCTQLSLTRCTTIRMISSESYLKVGIYFIYNNVGYLTSTLVPPIYSFKSLAYAIYVGPRDITCLTFRCYFNDHINFLDQMVEKLKGFSKSIYPNYSNDSSLYFLLSSGGQSITQNMLYNAKNCFDLAMSGICLSLHICCHNKL